MSSNHAEPAPLNDTNDAKGLEADPQLQEVERREAAARDQGQPQDEAQARAWAEVNAKPGGPGAPAAADDPDGTEPGKISIGG